MGPHPRVGAECQLVSDDARIEVVTCDEARPLLILENLDPHQASSHEPSNLVNHQELPTSQLALSDCQ
jgi:hypothetical protein